MAKILFVSASHDEHLPFVSRHFTSDDEVILIDPIDILKGEALDYECRNGHMQVYHRGRPLKKIAGIWYRRPTIFTSDDIPVVPEEKDYAFSSLSHHIRALHYLLPEALWMSDVLAIRRASSKPLQQVVAARLGFNIPDTLYATDAVRAEAFVRREKACIAKTLATDFPPLKLVFSKVVRPKDGLDYTGLRVDPYISQALIEPSRELRITVVGDRVFAARVERKEVAGEGSEFRDWRYGHVDGTFQATVFDLPQKISRQCVMLVKELGLEFGAIDIIIDKKEKYWFLEVNPNGQWAFIEHTTGLDIGEAIAVKLRTGKTNVS